MAKVHDTSLSEFSHVEGMEGSKMTMLYNIKVEWMMQEDPLREQSTEIPVWISQGQGTSVTTNEMLWNV